MRGKKRITAEHILAILERKKGVAIRFSDVKRAMLAKGWFHTDKAILDNFKVLVDQGKLVKVDRLIGIPIVRDDGTAYLKIWNCDTATIELRKVVKDAKP